MTAHDATYGETPEEWYEREKTAFRAWWESEGEKTFSRTPTLAAGAGWFARAEAAPETAPIVPCLATNGCTTPEWCARNGDACRVKTPVSETPRNQMAVKGCEPIKSPANVLVYAEEAGKALAESLDKDEIEIRRAASAPSAIEQSPPEHVTLFADPERAAGAHMTGIFVRGKMLDGNYGSLDIAELDRASLHAWLRSRGGKNLWAENVVLALLRYSQLGEGS